jgi:hypothetical protein
MTEKQFTLFDLPEGERRKELGMAHSRFTHEEVLLLARAIAKLHAFRHGTVTADDVQKELIKRGLPPLGNAAGSLFRGDQWEFTGQWVKSHRVTNHARQNRTWRLR